jgi:hypothetical protein
MKYVILMLLMSGCATVSDYNQGCRDALDESGLSNNQEKNRSVFCDRLEDLHKAEKKMGKQP